MQREHLLMESFLHTPHLLPSEELGAGEDVEEEDEEFEEEEEDEEGAVVESNL